MVDRIMTRQTRRVAREMVVLVAVVVVQEMATEVRRVERAQPGRVRPAVPRYHIVEATQVEVEVARPLLARTARTHQPAAREPPAASQARPSPMRVVVVVVTKVVVAPAVMVVVAPAQRPPPPLELLIVVVVVVAPVLSVIMVAPVEAEL